MSCDCFAKTKNHEFMACVRQCKRISRTLWKLTFSKSQQDQEDVGWEEVVMTSSKPSRYAPPPSLLRPSLNVQQSTSSYVIILCGGLEVLPTDTLENLTHSDYQFLPNNRLCLGSMQTRKWKQSWSGLGRVLIGSWSGNKRFPPNSNVCIFTRNKSARIKSI